MSVTLQLVGSTAILTLARPSRANALNREVVDRLHASLDEAESAGSVRALVITGEGSNFCAGADLSEIRVGGAHLRGLLERLGSFFNRLEKSPVVSIAAVHGAARAGGLELALACDFTIAAGGASFGDGHVLNGLLPGGGSSARLPRTIGWQRTKWLILSGQAIDAITARDWGLVLKVVDESALIKAAMDVAAGLSRVDAETMGKAKRLLANVPEQPLSISLASEITLLEAHSHSRAFKCGIDRFLNRDEKAVAARVTINS